MDIELKQKVIEFVSKITNSKPEDTIKDLEVEAFELETCLRQSMKVPVVLHSCPNELLEVMMQLSKPQKEHYESVYWLTHPHGFRGSGRTYCLALVHIQHSLCQGEWITLKDHDSRDTRRLLHECIGIINKCKELYIQFKERLHDGLCEIKITRRIDTPEEFKYKGK